MVGQLYPGFSVVASVGYVGWRTRAALEVAVALPIPYTWPATTHLVVHSVNLILRDRKGRSRTLVSVSPQTNIIVLQQTLALVTSERRWNIFSIERKDFIPGVDSNPQPRGKSNEVSRVRHPRILSQLGGSERRSNVCECEEHRKASQGNHDPL